MVLLLVLLVVLVVGEWWMSGFEFSAAAAAAVAVLFLFLLPLPLPAQDPAVEDDEDISDGRRSSGGEDDGDVAGDEGEGSSPSSSLATCIAAAVLLVGQRRRHLPDQTALGQTAGTALCALCIGGSSERGPTAPRRAAIVTACCCTSRSICSSSISSSIIALRAGGGGAAGRSPVAAATAAITSAGTTPAAASTGRSRRSISCSCGRSISRIELQALQVGRRQQGREAAQDQIVAEDGAGAGDRQKIQNSSSCRLFRNRRRITGNSFGNYSGALPAVGLLGRRLGRHARHLVGICWEWLAARIVHYLQHEMCYVFLIATMQKKDTETR